jgi:predicted  nucleic acid-binding Zn-ribbon protein
MGADKSVKHRNVKKIATSSVASAEIDDQRRKLITAERKLGRLDIALAEGREQIDAARERLAAVREACRTGKTAQMQRALNAAKKKLEVARRRRDKTLSAYREFKLVVRDQRSLLKSLEKKEIARQKAVAVFLKEWEREYDKKIRMKSKEIEKRKRTLDD